MKGLKMYYIDDRKKLISMGRTAGWADDKIGQLLRMLIGNSPSTWKTLGARDHGDIVGNWFAKELQRSGDSVRNSVARCNMYIDRKKLYNLRDFRIIREMAPEFCAISGQPLNYGLGLLKKLCDEYFTVVYGTTGISPSIERIDSSRSYVLENIEIISAFENIGRMQGVDTNMMRANRERLTEKA